MRKAKEAKKEYHVRIPWRIFDAHLPPAEHYVLTHLYKMADWHTGVVPFVSARSLETVLEGSLRHDTIQSALKRLEEWGYITRLIPEGCSGTYPVAISNFEGVDEKFRPIGVKNKKEVQRPVNERKLKPARNAGSSPGPTGRNQEGVQEGVQAGVQVGPPENLRTNQFSTSSTLSNSSKNSIKKGRAEKLGEADPPPPLEASFRPQAKAEKLAMHWWAFQGSRPDQAGFLPVWTDRFSELLSEYPLLEEGMAIWFKDVYWGDGTKGSVGAKHMLRYEGKGDPLDWFARKLAAPEDRRGTLWNRFGIWEKSCQKRNRPLPTLPPLAAPTAHEARPEDPTAPAGANQAADDFDSLSRPVPVAPAPARRPARKRKPARAPTPAEPPPKAARTSPGPAAPPKACDPREDPALRLEFARAQLAGMMRHLTEEDVQRFANGTFNPREFEDFDRWLKFRNSPPGPGDPLADYEKRLAFVLLKDEIGAKCLARSFYRWEDDWYPEFYEWAKEGKDAAPGSLSPTRAEEAQAGTRRKTPMDSNPTGGGRKAKAPSSSQEGGRGDDDHEAWLERQMAERKAERERTRLLALQQDDDEAWTEDYAAEQEAEWERTPLPPLPEDDGEAWMKDYAAKQKAEWERIHGKPRW